MTEEITACLARIEERQTHLVSKVEDIDRKVDAMANHTPRLVSLEDWRARLRTIADRVIVALAIMAILALIVATAQYVGVVQSLP